MRLGKLEEAILIACLEMRPSAKREGPHDPDLWRDELPGMLWGWPFTRRHGYWKFWRPWDRPPREYYGIAEAEYRAKQASLTRALQTLYAKGLIDAGSTMEATGHTIYSPRRAARLEQAPAQRRDDATMRERHHPKSFMGYQPRPWSYRSIGEKPRAGRNMKSIRLTDAGEARAVALALNRKNKIAI